MKSPFTFSQKAVVIIVLFFISLCLITNNSHPFFGCKSQQVVTKQDSIVPWKFPEVSTISDNEEGKLIRLGRSIFIETYKYIGPDVKDSNKRFIGNNMDCQNCHFNAGTQQNVFGLVGVYSKYPALDARIDKLISIEQRINSCMTRSMNGKPIPEQSNEMKVLVAYMKWLSTYVPKGKYVEGQGVPKIKLLDRAADTSKGRIVFADNCMTCHAEDGSGALNKPANAEVSADSLKGYDFPPVMGQNSYNDGAGLYRVLEATAFIFSKMPLNRHDLSLEKSYDVAAYINSLPRPNKSNVDNDYPNLKLKPIDFPFPPYDDKFPTEQHKYGPYQPMLKEGESSKVINPNVGF
ncbi:MAG: c-type cytochrome [bacterium]